MGKDKLAKRIEKSANIKTHEATKPAGPKLTETSKPGFYNKLFGWKSKAAI